MQPDAFAASSIPPTPSGPAELYNRVAMNQSDVRDILDAVATGKLTPEEAEFKLRVAPFTDLGYAKPDTSRGLRTGASEVVYGAGKTAQQIEGIVRSLVDAGEPCVLITRLDAQKASELDTNLGDLVSTFTYHDDARIGYVGDIQKPNGNGRVLICSAGTSDLPVAEEAALTAQVMQSEVDRLYDVGVAGIHRLLAHSEKLMTASAVVAVAGMEGALASVVGGLCPCPVIAVPTSVGYGASFGGIAALLSMLNSCASGVSVVNIDNGFGAGYQAALIDHARTQQT